LEGGFFSRILLRGIGPLIPVVAVAASACLMHVARGTDRSWRSSVQEVLPLISFIAFVFVGPTASGIFAAWTCETFDADSFANPPITTAFLIADLSLKCDSSDQNYQRIASLAYVFVGVWPIGIPLIFLAVLLQCRAPILQGRTTRLVRSTAFLHREYQKHVFWWEVLLLSQRMFVIGMVQWIPHTQLFIRILFGTLASFLYLAVLFLVRPYKRNDVLLAAFAIQSAIILILFSALCIQLFTSLHAVDPLLTMRVLGFDSMDSLVAIMIITNLSLFATFILFTVYHAVFGNRMQVLRLSKSHEVPQLSLKRGMKYHLFLSHIWASAQDQNAIIKRMVQLFVPGAILFLDVDDLDEGAGAEHVTVSLCVSIFLSKGYFFSPNCLKEIDSALAGCKPLILVHESDVARGGASLDKLRADCESRGRMAVFEKGGDVIPWHRVSDFQLLTLKMLAARMLHCMPAYASKNKPPKLYLPGELSLQTLDFRRPVCLYTSTFNPGATDVMNQLAARYKSANLKVVEYPPPQLRPEGTARSYSCRSSAGAAYKLSRLSRGDRASSSQDGDRVTHMLLYLNNQTFVGEAREALAHELKQARSHSITIVLVHECDTTYGGCPFDVFFELTPPELIADGLYKKIAIACHAGAHRLVSLAIIAKELGAVPKHSQVAEAIRRGRSTHLSGRSSLGHMPRESAAVFGASRASAADSATSAAAVTQESSVGENCSADRV